jgi:hypothetical protein
MTLFQLTDDGLCSYFVLMESTRRFKLPGPDRGEFRVLLEAVAQDGPSIAWKPRVEGSDKID